MLNIIMTTYCPEPGHPRGVYGPRVINSLYEHLITADKPRLIVANDGVVDEPHCYKIAEAADGLCDKILIVGGPRAGIGGSLNRALEHVSYSDTWMYLTDDWALTEDYDLSQAERLISEAGYHYVRLGPPHPNIRCTTRFTAGLGWWLQLLPAFGGFAFATRPFIATPNFWSTVGRFKENCDAYVCERDYSDRVTQADQLPMAEVVSGTLQGPWLHIGEAEVGDKFP